jgi:uncharacterized coiled-coil protein SlyX
MPAPTPSPGRPGAAAPRRFRLLRYFSTASLLALVVVTAALTLFFAWRAELALVQQTEQKNAAQLRLILNHLADVERSTLASLVGATSAPAADDDRVRRMLDIVARSVAGTTIVKLKLYNLRGLTVFSTELKQIGEDKSDYAGYLAARGGRPSSQLSRRESFEALNGTLRNVDLIGSYLPVQEADGRVVGVVEIYDNVSQLAQTIRETRWQILGLSVGLLLALYLALLAIVGRADRILRDKAQALEREVAQRTRIAGELQDALKSMESAQRATEHAYSSAVAARREAEAATVARTEFLQKTNEALRTPINSAIGLLDVLRTDSLSAGQQAQLQGIRAHLLALLDRLSAAVAQAVSGPAEPPRPPQG